MVVLSSESVRACAAAAARNAAAAEAFLRVLELLCLRRALRMICEVGAMWCRAIIWLFSELPRENEREQLLTGHLKGFSPVCVS